MSLLKQVEKLHITFSCLSCDHGSIIVSLKLNRNAAPAANLNLGKFWSSLNIRRIRPQLDFIPSKSYNFRPTPTQKYAGMFHLATGSFTTQPCVILLVILQHGLFPSLSSSPPTSLWLASDVQGLHCCH